MRYILKFNESKTDNVELVKDIIADFLDEFNIESMISQQKIISDDCISDVIFKNENERISPSFIGSIRNNGNYHLQFGGSQKYDNDIKLVKKYSNYKSIVVIIRFYDGKDEIISKLESCKEIFESYGLICTDFKKYTYSKMILLKFCIE